MIYKEFLTKTRTQEWETLKTNYPNFFKYIERRFKNMELRYEEDVFEDLFIATVINNQSELSFAETSTNATNTAISEDKLGSISTSNINSENQFAQSYEGYNVEGDFSKNRDTSDMTSTTKSIDYLGYLSTINKNNFKNTWKKILKEVYSLFICLGDLYEN